MWAGSVGEAVLEGCRGVASVESHCQIDFLLYFCLLSRVSPPSFITRLPCPYVSLPVFFSSSPQHVLSRQHQKTHVRGRKKVVGVETGRVT